MATADTRWVQRFESYNQALCQLDLFIQQGQLNQLEALGLVKAFEYTFELAWNLLKDFLEYPGFTEIIGSRGAIKEAFRQHLLGGTEADGLCWMAMIRSRNLSAHAYSQQVFEVITEKITTEYHQAFTALGKRLAPLVPTPHD